MRKNLESELVFFPTKPRNGQKLIPSRAKLSHKLEATVRGKLSLQSLVLIVIGMILIAIPFLYYWIRSLRMGTRIGEDAKPSDLEKRKKEFH